MAISSAAHQLPRKRTGSFIAWVERSGTWYIAFMGIAFYCLIAIAFSILEFKLYPANHSLILDSKGDPVSHLSDIIYFNLITALTVGYGDMHPISYGKIFSVLEAFMGVGIFSILVAIITIKALLPPRNTIVFSKYAYYCTEPERFLIIFVNTTNQAMGNVEISSYFKLGGDWGVKPSITSPLITKSVQTFYIEYLPAQLLIHSLRDGDCLRVGISGGIGFSNFSTSVQYSADDILILHNRSTLIEYFEPLWETKFQSPTFQQMFHFRPENAVTLRSFVENARSSQ